MWERALSTGVRNGVKQTKDMDVSGHLKKASVQIVSDDLQLWRPIHSIDLMDEQAKKKEK